MKSSFQKERAIPAAATLFLLIYAVGFSLDQGPPPKFTNITKLTIIDAHTPNQDSFEVTDPTHVNWLIEKIQLRPARPCMCEHRWVIVFHPAKGDPIRAGLSDHSFEVKNRFGQQHFGMPAELYRRFNSLVKHYSSEI
ncbi:hypothetical protein VSU19_13880 [Verrucomicrobiales bacterium BCK34]|nr:hypothetical protein [Verrucomicrobiales bacterium BCK34]